MHVVLECVPSGSLVTVTQRATRVTVSTRSPMSAKRVIQSALARVCKMDLENVTQFVTVATESIPQLISVKSVSQTVRIADKTYLSAPSARLDTRLMTRQERVQSKLKMNRHETRDLSQRDHCHSNLLSIFKNSIFTLIRYCHFVVYVEIVPVCLIIVFNVLLTSTVKLFDFM